MNFMKEKHDFYKGKFQKKWFLKKIEKIWKEAVLERKIWKIWKIWKKKNSLKPPEIRLWWFIFSIRTTIYRFIFSIRLWWFIFRTLLSLTFSIRTTIYLTVTTKIIRTVLSLTFSIGTTIYWTVLSLTFRTLLSLTFSIRTTIYCLRFFLISHFSFLIST